MATEEVLPGGEKIRQAVRWMSETKALYQEKTRTELIREAEIRFDLSPRECEFLDRNFSCPEETA